MVSTILLEVTCRIWLLIFFENFTMSSCKVSYLVLEATGPNFKQVVANDVKNSGSPFTLQYDETTNAQINKHLDIKIRYQSSAQ